MTYDALKPEELRRIVDVQLVRVGRNLAEKDIQLELSNAAKDALAEEGWDPEYGARPLKRAIQRHVKNLLADAILDGRLADGALAKVDFGEGGYTLEIVPARASEPVAELAQV